MTSDVQLAWRNLWRNRRRSLLSMGGIAFAAGILVFILSMQASQYQLMLRASVEGGTGYLQAQAKGYQDDPQMWLVVAHPGAVELAMRAELRIVATTPRAEAFSLLASESHAMGGLVIGVRPDGERAVTSVVRTVHEGAFLESGDYDRAVIGALLARNLGVGLGDAITVLGSARDGSVAAAQVTIKGIFETGQPEVDRTFVYVPLGFFDEIYRMDGAVHRVIARADGLWWLGGCAERLTAKVASAGTTDHPVEVLTWRQLLPGVLEAIQLDMTIGGAMYIILVLVVAFSILNTFIMAVFERTREFGVMMAIGTTPGRLVRVLGIESVFLSLVGAALGVVLGSLVTAWLAREGIYFGEEAAKYMAQYGLPPRMRPELNWLTALLGPSVVFAVTVVASLVPAWRVRRLRPVEAMRAA